MCVWNNGLLLNQEGISNEYSQAVKMYTDTMLVTKALLVIGLHELRLLRKAKWSSVTNHALAGQQQQSLRRCCNVLMNWSERTDGLQPKDKLSASKGSVNNIIVPWGMQKCVHGGLHEA
jgi:hypothetical protein